MSGKRSFDVANQVFGFNGWKSEIVKSRIETAEETLDGKFTAFVETTIRVTIRDGTYCEATGCGKAYNSRAKHVALGKAKKHALTDAKKRALQKFGILDQMILMNNETYQAAELKNDGLSPPLMAPFLTKPSKKKNGGLFKRSGKLDLQKTTFNARKDVVFIKHKPISELTLPDPNLKLSQQIVGFAPTKSHDHLLKRQESSSSISLSPNNHNVNTLASKKHEPKTTSINMIASKPLSERKVESKSTSKVELKEQSVKNIERHDIKAEDPIHQNLRSDKKEIQIPTIPALSLQDSFSYDGDEGFFAELLKQEEDDDSLMDEIDDGILGSLSTQALVGNR